MFNNKLIIIALLFITVLVSGCGTDNLNEDVDIELIISAASSLTDALDEVKASFETDYPNIILTFNFGGSGKLAQQIDKGAPVDVYLSASQKFMDQIHSKGVIDENTRTNFVSNHLVIVTKKDNILDLNSFEDIATEDVELIAIGDPESVPAGRYAKEIFNSLQLWDKSQDKFVLAKDVRQVLTYTESGNVDIGIVYYSDALISKQVKIIATADEKWHQPIVYPAAVIKNSKHKDSAKFFLEYLTSDKGKNIFEKYGFN